MKVLTAPPEVYRYSGSRLCNPQLGSPKPPRAGSEPLTANEPSHGDLNASRGFRGTGGPWVGFPRSKPQDKGWRASRLFGSCRKSWSGSEEVTQGRGGGPERVSHHTGETSRCKSAHEHGNPEGQGAPAACASQERKGQGPGSSERLSPASATPTHVAMWPRDSHGNTISFGVPNSSQQYRVPSAIHGHRARRGRNREWQRTRGRGGEKRGGWRRGCSNLRTELKRGAKAHTHAHTHGVA